MAPVVGRRKNDDWIDTRDAPRKRSCNPLQNITNRGRRPSISSKRITRSRSRVKGSTNDSAIAIYSSSDESGDDDMVIDGCLMPTEEAEDDVLVLQVQYSHCAQIYSALTLYDV